MLCLGTHALTIHSVKRRPKLARKIRTRRLVPIDHNIHTITHIVPGPIVDARIVKVTAPYSRLCVAALAKVLRPKVKALIRPLGDVLGLEYPAEFSAGYVLVVEGYALQPVQLGIAAYVASVFG